MYHKNQEDWKRLREQTAPPRKRKERDPVHDETIRSVLFEIQAFQESGQGSRNQPL